MIETIQPIRDFVTENFLFGQDSGVLSDSASFLENGVIDSTGLLELIGFIERTYHIRLSDDELTPENLDSLARISAFLARRVPAEIA